MTEFSEQGSLPSSPLQARGLFDLVQELEGETEKHNISYGFSTTTDSIPDLIDANTPQGVVYGTPQPPHLFEIYCAAKYYENVPATFSYLLYQQTASVEITKVQDIPKSFAELVTKFEYSFFVNQNGAYFIHREESQVTRPNIEGDLIHEERMGRLVLKAQIEEMEKGSDPVTRASIEEINSSDETHETSWTADFFAEHEPTEAEIEADRSFQAEMLDDRINGYGIVSAAEAEALRALLNTVRPV